MIGVTYTYEGATLTSNYYIYRMPLEGKDAYQLLDFAGTGNGLGQNVEGMPLLLVTDPVSGCLYACNIWK
ncbi:MAG: hypothetical protein NT045_06580, partial [Candidatus Aureabacteria bacterium]|nr:hypothetical protein [Candidatus Auribacterota bacterium]